MNWYTTMIYSTNTTPFAFVDDSNNNRPSDKTSNKRQWCIGAGTVHARVPIHRHPEISRQESQLLEKNEGGHE